MRRRDTQPQRAGKQAQHEAGRDQKDIQDHDVLEPETVGDINGEVGKENPWCRSGVAQREHATGDEAGCTKCERSRNADRARRERTKLLLWMLPVLLAINQIVHHINGRSKQTEGCKGRYGGA